MVGFPTNEEIIRELCRPFGLAYTAARLGTSRERCRSVRDANKTQIVQQRVEVHRQTAAQIAFQLEIPEALESLKLHITKTYGDSHAQD